MDNVLKLILGFLGVVALVILAIPSSDSSDDAKVVKPIVAPKPSSKAVASASPAKSTDDKEEKSSKDDDWGDDEFESFGQPMNDAKPLGMGGSGNDDGGAIKGNADNASYPVGSPAIGGRNNGQPTTTENDEGE